MDGSKIPEPIRLRTTVEKSQIMIWWELETSTGITTLHATNN